MSSRRKFIQASGGAVAAAALLRTGALGQGATPAATPAVAIGDISVLPLKEPGKLIVHADQPLYEPWFVDNDPSNGQGFESALTYAIAEQLGFKLQSHTHQLYGHCSDCVAATPAKSRSSKG